ncbi:hypothetical protein BBJ28_00014002 [Nothophytophthora sp. Chile5]|nr:hypothetical protein BBJ28_00014002 [Nothophytophthora sp. Chile5]
MPCENRGRRNLTRWYTVNFFLFVTNCSTHQNEAMSPSLSAVPAPATELASTPPPSPSTAASLTGTWSSPPPPPPTEAAQQQDQQPVHVSSDLDLWASDASSDDDGEDSDYTPGAKAKKKRRSKKVTKRRRLVRGDDRKKRLPRQDDEEDDDSGDLADALSEVAIPSSSRSQQVQTKRKRDRKAAAATWADDGSLELYRRRLHDLRRELQDSVQAGRTSFYNKPRTVGSDAVEETEEEEGQPAFYSPWDVTETASGLTVPSYVLAQLLPHQRECLEWLHGLHERGVGGILGDDMGLGKTVQLAAFLGALHHARRLRSVLLLCPASVLLQWVRELHKWVPWLRVVLLHASGTGVTSSISGECYAQLIEEVFRYEDEASDAESDASEPSGMRSNTPTGGGVVITTYENVRQCQSLFLTREWDYVVLDEGHRIRNPDAETTLACKQLQTVHRVILTGTPIQNRLRELWSLFDFVYPGRLGTLPTFDDEFVLPIRAGGYATATKMQVLMAYKCALALKDLIRPFLLRRTKQEVLTDGGGSSMSALLPGKREQILFCRLTARQRALYKRFLSSPEVAAVLRRDIRPFRAISVLRHICNHPDLLASFGDGRLADRKRQMEDEDEDQGISDISGFLEEAADGVEDERYGAASASGKLLVLQKVLATWKTQGHRVLVFTQTRGMLDILESLMSRLGHTCCRLDGTTNVAERQSRLDAFNAPDSDLFVFLLTTRAGGIGVNLVGADRVVVFDPDWNPSTDLQARERAWRIGQKKPVTVYRFVTAGTIEEKIYHRQIFKQYLTSKVLHDAKRKRCFNKHSLRDLFVLADEKEDGDGAAETSELFVAGHVDRPVEEASVELEDGEEDGEEDESPQKQQENGDNDAVLKQLFDGGEVRAVFDHSAVESDGVQNQEADLVEMEASKVAQGALSALRASGALVRQQRETIYTPTWTGRSGAAGDPSQRRQQPVPRGRGGRGRGRAGSSSALSSREMLAKIRQRRDGLAAQAASVQPRVPSQTAAPATLTASDMTKRLHSFLVANAATGVTTERLLENFADLVAPKDKLVFRHVLRDMAVCRGRRWTLKPEYSMQEAVGASRSPPDPPFRSSRLRRKAKAAASSSIGVDDPNDGDEDDDSDESEDDAVLPLPVIPVTLPPLLPQLPTASKTHKETPMAAHPVGFPEGKVRRSGLQAKERAMHRISGTVSPEALVRRPSGRRWRARASDYDEQLARAHIFKPPLPPTHTEKRRVAAYCTCHQIALFKLLNWLEKTAKESRSVEAAASGEAPVAANFGFAGWKNKMHLGVLHSSFAPATPECSSTEERDTTTSPRVMALQQKHAFFFATGCCVFWGLTREEEARHLLTLASFSIGSMDQVVAQDMEFSYGDSSNIAKDAIVLSSTDVAEKLALSFAMAQSATLGAFETHVEERIRSTRHIPSSLATVGSIQYSQDDTSKLIGQLFIELADVNLHSNILDEPEYFQKSQDDNYELFYQRMLKYQDVSSRVGILNKRLSILRDLYVVCISLLPCSKAMETESIAVVVCRVGVLNQQLTHHNGTKLEWIIIWMLVAQVVIAIGWEIILKDVLGCFRW